MSQRYRIMVVDDDPDIRFVTMGLLGTDFETVQAENGLDALEKIERYEPDLLLVDIGMPVMDGFATCRSIRRHDEFSDMPVFFLTGISSDDAREKAKEAGCQAFIEKPFDTIELIEQIRGFFVEHKQIPRSKLFSVDELEKIDVTPLRAAGEEAEEEETVEEYPDGLETGHEAETEPPPGFLEEDDQTEGDSKRRRIFGQPRLREEIEEGDEPTRIFKTPLPRRPEDHFNLTVPHTFDTARETGEPAPEEKPKTEKPEGKAPPAPEFDLDEMRRRFSSKRAEKPKPKKGPEDSKAPVSRDEISAPIVKGTEQPFEKTTEPLHEEFKYVKKSPEREAMPPRPEPPSASDDDWLKPPSAKRQREEAPREKPPALEKPRPAAREVPPPTPPKPPIQQKKPLFAEETKPASRKAVPAGPKRDAAAEAIRARRRIPDSVKKKSKSAGPKPRVMCLIENKTELAGYTEAVKGRGEFLPLEDPVEAVEIIARFQPDVVFLHIAGKTYSGLQVGQMIQTNARLSHIELVFLFKGTETIPQMRAAERMTSNKMLKSPLIVQEVQVVLDLIKAKPTFKVREKKLSYGAYVNEVLKTIQARKEQVRRAREQEAFAEQHEHLIEGFEEVLKQYKPAVPADARSKKELQSYYLDI